MIRLEDWQYEDEAHPVCVYIYLHEDTRKPGYRWETTTFAWRRRALRAAELTALMQQAGFAELTFLEQASPWRPHEVLARRPP